MGPDPDTNAGGGRFPPTRHSAIQAIKSDDLDEQKRALDLIIKSYWQAVYTYLRLKWRRNSADAEDLTQAFFAAALEKDYLSAYEIGRSRFRTYLRTCVDRYVQNSDRAASRIKRGGDTRFVSAEDRRTDEGPADVQSAHVESPEALFEREWIRSLFTIAVDSLEKNCANENKHTHFAVFKRYDLDRIETNEEITYKQLADEFDLDNATINNYLAWSRRRFREIVLETLAQLTATEQEYRDEARIVLGIDVES